MRPFPDTLRNTLFCWGLLALVFSAFGQGTMEDDLMPITSFPRAYNTVTEKSTFHQNRVHGMKRDLNDYGSQVYDLRRRFDLIFKNRQTDLAPPTPFDLGTQPARLGTNQGKVIQYLGPDSPHRLRRTDPRVRQAVQQPEPEPQSRPEPQPVGPTGNLQQPEEEVSPLAFVVDGPNQAPRRQAPVAVDIPANRKFDYFILPRFGISVPANGDYDGSLSFAATGGIVREDWRLGVEFSYSGHDSSSIQIRNLTGEPLPYHSEADVDNYAFLVGLTREVPLGAGWSGSVGLGIGAGWSISDSRLLFSGGTAYTLSEKKEIGLAWQLGFGASRPMGEAASVFLGYRYLGHPEVSSHNFEAGAEFGF